MSESIPHFQKEAHCLEICDQVQSAAKNKYEQINGIVGEMLNAWSSKDCFEHISPVTIPSHDKIIDIVNRARGIIFPGYFTTTKLHAANLEYYIGKETMALYEKLSEQISVAIRHDCRRNGRACTHCDQEGSEKTLALLHRLPEITETLAEDIRATLAGDPAIQSPDEVIFCYPGLLATLIYRIAHELYLLKVPFIPRIMTEYAHSLTGIDIHPGATIASGFFIDHGTGVVIGETTIIGHNVRLYQGVTLGALSLPRDAGATLKATKRHPTIEDDVIIYANTTVLGGDTILGEGSVVGGNSWVTKSVAPGSMVFLKKPEVIVKDVNGDKQRL